MGAGVTDAVVCGWGTGGTPVVEVLTSGIGTLAVVVTVVVVVVVEMAEDCGAATVVLGFTGTTGVAVVVAATTPVAGSFCTGTAFPVEVVVVDVSALDDAVVCGAVFVFVFVFGAGFGSGYVGSDGVKLAGSAAEDVVEVLVLDDTELDATVVVEVVDGSVLVLGAGSTLELSGNALVVDVVAEDVLLVVNAAGTALDVVVGVEAGLAQKSGRMPE